MSDHYSEYDLEIFLLSPETLSEREKKKIKIHVDECLLCKEHIGKLELFYKNLEENNSSPPTERDAAFAHHVLAKKGLSFTGRKAELREKSDSLVETFAEVIETYRGSFIERALRYFRVHPVRLAGIVSFAAVALVLAFITIRPTLDKNPAIAQTKDGFLIINNQHGDELWRKYIGANFSFSAAPTFIMYHPERTISMLDVDGDGTNEVACIFGWTSMQLPINNLLVCYNADGTERWKYEIHRTMTLGGVLYSDQYRFYHMEAGDFTHSGNIEIVAAAHHNSWNPNVLLRLDGKSGKLVSEFWHPGELREFGHKDLGHDGVEDLVYGGQNNRLQHACVTVFDPRTIVGSAPAPEEYYPKEFPAGTEKYYVIFPASDLKQFATDITNEVSGLQISNDRIIEVIVNEPLATYGGTLYYYFDSSLTCINVRPSDSFTAAHNQLERDGKLTTHLDSAYFDALRNGVMYWDGDKFVNRVTMNRRYIEAMKPPPIP